MEAVGQSDDATLSERLAASLEELEVAEEELRAQNTALLEAQEALELEQGQYRVLFDSAPEPYLVTDMNGTIRLANPAAMTALNAQRHLVGKPLIALVALDDRSVFRERMSTLARVADAMPPIRMELELLPWRGNGFRATVTVTRSTSPQDGSGILLWIVHELRDATARDATARDATARDATARDATARDATARGASVADFHSNAAKANREMIAELRRVNSELRGANRETLTLLHREQKLRRALERAESAKSRFFALLGHELRTPLQAIFGYTELLVRTLGESATPTVRDFLQRMERSERHLLSHQQRHGLRAHDARHACATRRWADPGRRGARHPPGDDVEPGGGEANRAGREVR